MVVSQVMTAATVTVAQAAVGPIPGQPLTPPAVLPLFLGVPLALMALAVLAPWRQARNALSLIGPLITGVAGAWLFSLHRGPWDDRPTRWASMWAGWQSRLPATSFRR